MTLCWGAPFSFPELHIILDFFNILKYFSIVNLGKDVKFIISTVVVGVNLPFIFYYMCPLYVIFRSQTLILDIIYICISVMQL